MCSSECVSRSPIEMVTSLSVSVPLVVLCWTICTVAQCCKKNYVTIYIYIHTAGLSTTHINESLQSKQADKLKQSIWDIDDLRRTEDNVYSHLIMLHPDCLCPGQYQH